MRIVPRAKGMPKLFIKAFPKSGIILEGALRLHHERRVMKVVVFKHRSEMQRFYNGPFKKYRERIGVSSDICEDAVMGMVCTQETEHIQFEPQGEKHWIEVDPHFWSVMILCLDSLNIMVMSHEAVHAAFAYTRQHPRNRWTIHESDEEHICYPAGYITEMLDNWLKRERGYIKEVMRCAKMRPKKAVSQLRA